MVPTGYCKTLIVANIQPKNDSCTITMHQHFIVMPICSQAKYNITKQGSVRGVYLNHFVEFLTLFSPAPYPAFPYKDTHTALLSDT